MRFAIVRSLPGLPTGRVRSLSDSAALAAVETGRWLRDQGISPRLAWSESGLTEIQAEIRLCAPFNRHLPRGGGNELLGWSWNNVVKELLRIDRLRQKDARRPEGLGDDILTLVGERTFAMLVAELMPLGHAFDKTHDSASFIVEGDPASMVAGTIGATTVVAVWPGRAAGDSAMVSRPVPRVPRDPTLRMPEGRAQADRPWEEYQPHRADALELSDTPLLDAYGQKLPAMPVKKLQIVCQWQADISMTSWFTVAKVTKTAFEMEMLAGQRRTYALEDWHAWLRRRMSEGATTVHFDGCPNGWCSACDGARGAPWPEAVAKQLAKYGKADRS